MVLDRLRSFLVPRRNLETSKILLVEPTNSTMSRLADFEDLLEGSGVKSREYIFKAYDGGREMIARRVVTAGSLQEFLRAGTTSDSNVRGARRRGFTDEEKMDYGLWCVTNMKGISLEDATAVAKEILDRTSDSEKYGKYLKQLELIKAVHRMVSPSADEQ